MAKAALRDGHEIGCDQISRLMRSMGIEGVTRLRRLRTTVRVSGRLDPERLGVVTAGT